MCIQRRFSEMSVEELRKIVVEHMNTPTPHTLISYQSALAELQRRAGKEAGK